jgi:hypothetical protein
MRHGSILRFFEGGLDTHLSQIRSLSLTMKAVFGLLVKQLLQISLGAPALAIVPPGFKAWTFRTLARDNQRLNHPHQGEIT